jgi:hypothetical protein
MVVTAFQYNSEEVPMAGHRELSELESGIRGTQQYCGIVLAPQYQSLAHVGDGLGHLVRVDLAESFRVFEER